MILVEDYHKVYGEVVAVAGLWALLARFRPSRAAALTG